MSEALTRMPRAPRVRAFRVPATPLARLTIISIGCYGVAQGMMILFLSNLRFSGPSFAYLRTVPGGPNTWGFIALVAGTLVLCASATHTFVMKAVGLIVLAAWAMCFAVGVLLAAIDNPVAGATGIATYVLIAVCASIVVWVDESKEYRP